MSFVELVGTTVLAGAVILAVLGLNFLVSDSSRDFGSDLIVQETMTDFTQLIQCDFAKIGCRVAAGPAILISRPDTLKFLGDIDNNGTIDTVQYFKTPVSSLSSTKNPNDFLLCRVVTPNTRTLRMNVGLTRFDLTYLDSTGASTVNPASVRGVKISGRVESQSPRADGRYSGSYWENTIYPRNLNLAR